MPRIANEGNNVDIWWEECGEGTSTHDICEGCWEEFYQEPFSEMKGADNRYKGLDTYNGDPMGDSSHDCGPESHPDYGDEDYECGICGEPLTDDDN